MKRYSWQTDSSTEPARLTRLRQIVQVPKTSSVIIRTEIVDLGRVGGRIDGVSITLKSPEENTEILKKIC